MCINFDTHKQTACPKAWLVLLEESESVLKKGEGQLMNKEIKGEPNLMSIQQTAEYLGLSVGTIYQWRSQHKIPYIKVGRKVRFRKEQLEQWLAERTVQVGLKPELSK